MTWKRKSPQARKRAKKRKTRLYKAIRHIANCYWDSMEKTTWQFLDLLYIRPMTDEELDEFK